jgi:hypothetical protein
MTTNQFIHAFIDFDDWAAEHLPAILAWPIQLIWFVWILAVVVLFYTVVAIIALFVPPNKFKNWWKEHHG